jgi:hypothetical protein
MHSGADFFDEFEEQKTAAAKIIVTGVGSA